MKNNGTPLQYFPTRSRSAVASGGRGRLENNSGHVHAALLSKGSNLRRQRFDGFRSENTGEGHMRSPKVQTQRRGGEGGHKHGLRRLGAAP